MLHNTLVDVVHTIKFVKDLSTATCHPPQPVSSGQLCSSPSHQFDYPCHLVSFVKDFLTTEKLQLLKNIRQ